MTGWSIPRTWVADEIPPTAIFNAHIRDQMLHIKSPPVGMSALAANVTITATTFTNVNTALNVGLTTYGGILEVNGAGGGAGDRTYVDVAVDGTRVGPGSNGLIDAAGTGNRSFNVRVTGIASGAHVIALQAKVDGGNAGRIVSGYVFEVMEIP